jgi:hypothetical protein
MNAVVLVNPFADTRGTLALRTGPIDFGTTHHA